jgi:hypothetical protein
VDVNYDMSKWTLTEGEISATLLNTGGYFANQVLENAQLSQYVIESNCKPKKNLTCIQLYLYALKNMIIDGKSIFPETTVKAILSNIQKSCQST